MTVEFSNADDVGLQARVLTAWDDGELVGRLTITYQAREAQTELSIHHWVGAWKSRVEVERRRFHWDAADRVKRRTLNLWGSL